MSYNNETLKLRLPTGRPLTPKEHDENWSKIATMLDRIQTEFEIRMPTPRSIPGVNYTGKAHMIAIYSGSEADIPDGWQLSDGTNGTVDLRSKFVAGSDGSTYSGTPNDGGFTATAQGGQHTAPDHRHSNPNVDGHALLITEIPEHQHSSFDGTQLWISRTERGKADTDTPTNNVGRNELGAFTPNSGKAGGGASPPAADPHSHTQGNTGLAGGHDNRPSYYALCYIAFIDKQHS